MQADTLVARHEKVNCFGNFDSRDDPPVTPRDRIVRWHGALQRDEQGIQRLPYRFRNGRATRCSAGRNSWRAVNVDAVGMLAVASHALGVL